MSAMNMIVKYPKKVVVDHRLQSLEMGWIGGDSWERRSI